MTLTDLLEKYGVWALMAYIVITDTVPKVLTFSQKIIAHFAPERLKRLEIQEEEQKRKESEEEEKRASEHDLQERQIVANEQIAKSLVLIDDHLQNTDKLIRDQMSLQNTALITANQSLATVNQSLAILLDRSVRHRETDRLDVPPRSKP